MEYHCQSRVWRVSQIQDFRDLVFSIKKEVSKDEVGMARVVASNLVMSS